MTTPTHPDAFGVASTFPRVENVTFSMSLGNGVAHFRVGANEFTMPRTQHMDELLKRILASG